MVHTQAPGQLPRHRGEHFRRLFPARDQRRHPSQGSLLLGEHGEVGAGLGVGDRGRDQIREVPDARLGIGWQRRGSVEPTIAAPHRRPSTMIGAPTAVRRPRSRKRAATEPEAFS